MYRQHAWRGDNESDSTDGVRLGEATRTQRARNEGIFRNINEQIRQLAYDLQAPAFRTPAAEAHDFICECSRLTCMEKVEMSLYEYEYVRDHPARFLVVPGHGDHELETVVREAVRYHVVEKHPQFAWIAAGRDTRADEVAGLLISMFAATPTR